MTTRPDIASPGNQPGGTGTNGHSIHDVLALVPGIPLELAQIVLDVWIETGDWTLAVARMRQSPDYDTYFPGNRRDDGSLRYDENTYLAMIEGFGDIIGDLGINPSIFASDFINLISGNVSIPEFESRVRTLSRRVLQGSDAIRAEYASIAGLEMTDEALIAAALSPRVNLDLINRKLDIAEISAQAVIRGLGSQLEIGERLLDLGAGAQGAGQLFEAAAIQLPTLDVLAQKHLDPDDDFSLDEFVEGLAFGNLPQRRRIQRLFAQESALFGRQSSIREDQQGALVGLTAR